MNVETLNKYFEDGLLYKQSHPTLPLTIWNYSEKVQYEGLWDEVTVQCRGLVTDNNGNVVAKPFPKFFNIEEGKHTPTEEFEVFEKMDGSLGIAFKYNGEVIYATRGSFTSDQSKWMSNYGKEYNFHNILVEGFTYLFEIIYPENRIVVDYGGQERLVLLGIINTETGEELSYDDIIMVPWDIVKKYDGIKDYTTLKGMVENNAEGFVVRFSNGDRMKIKGEEYLRLHKIMTNISTTGIWEHLSTGGNMDDILKEVPDEFYSKIKEYENELIIQYDTLLNEYQWIFNKVRNVYFDVYQKEFNRREFAELAKRYKYPSLLFGLLDGKDITPLIWKLVKPEWRKL
jgi:T4 RnlA family RNA ligase